MPVRGAVSGAGGAILGGDPMPLTLCTRSCRLGNTKENTQRFAKAGGGQPGVAACRRCCRNMFAVPHWHWQGCDIGFRDWVRTLVLELTTPAAVDSAAQPAQRAQTRVTAPGTAAASCERASSPTRSHNSANTLMDGGSLSGGGEQVSWLDGTDDEASLPSSSSPSSGGQRASLPLRALSPLGPFDVDMDELFAPITQSVTVPMVDGSQRATVIVSPPPPAVTVQVAHAVDHDSAQSGCRTTRLLPPAAAEVFRGWMAAPEHLAHPYPTDSDRVQLAELAGVTPKQVSVWFTNARKRVWIPMKQSRGCEGRRKGPGRTKKARPVPGLDLGTVNVKRCGSQRDTGESAAVNGSGAATVTTNGTATTTTATTATTTAVVTTPSDTAPVPASVQPATASAAEPRTPPSRSRTDYGAEGGGTTVLMLNLCETKSQLLAKRRFLEQQLHDVDQQLSMLANAGSARAHRATTP